MKARRRLGRQLQRLLQRVDQEEQQEPDRQRQREVEGAPAAGLERRVEQHAQRHRHDADEQADQPERLQAAAGRRRHRHVDRVLERHAGSAEQHDVHASRPGPRDRGCAATPWPAAAAAPAAPA